MSQKPISIVTPKNIPIQEEPMGSVLNILKSLMEDTFGSAKPVRAYGRFFQTITPQGSFPNVK